MRGLHASIFSHFIGKYPTFCTSIKNFIYKEFFSVAGKSQKTTELPIKGA
jgi:hypothetical protein